MSCNLLWLEKISTFVETNIEEVSLCVREIDLLRPFFSLRFHSKIAVTIALWVSIIKAFNYKGTEFVLSGAYCSVGQVTTQRISELSKTVSSSFAKPHENIFKANKDLRSELDFVVCIFISSANKKVGTCESFC